jgi:hypothetical protein
VIRTLKRETWSWQMLLALATLMASFVSLILIPNDSFASPREHTPTTKTLFSLPLEQLLEIRLDGTDLDRSTSSSERIRAKPSSFRASVDQRRFNRRVLRLANLQQWDDETRIEKVLLSIDGDEIGSFDGAREIGQYLNYFRRKTHHLQILRGESAHWWSNGRTRAAIHIVTRGASPRARPARSTPPTSLREEARSR